MRMTAVCWQLKALAGYGLKGQVTMKQENGQVTVLASVPMCGLNAVNGSKGKADRSNIARYAGWCLTNRAGLSSLFSPMASIHKVEDKS